MLQQVTVFGGLTKADTADDGTLKIEGIASAEVVDSAGETILASAMKAAIPLFMNGGKGALRVMHQATVAAGTVDEVEVDDETGLTKISGTVVDGDTIRQIRLKVLRGLSIGGKVTSRDPKNSKIITGVDWRELSLVDRPANSSCVVTIAKVAPAAPLAGLHALTSDALEVVRHMSAAELEDLVSRLPQQERALLLVNIVLRNQVGRRI